MQQPENRAVVQRLIEEGLNRKNVDIVDELVAEHAVDRDPFPGAPAGREGFRFEFQTLKTAFPDLHVTFTLFADGDTVIEEWRGQGTQTGPFLGGPATGRAVDYTGITIMEVENGLIVSRRSYQDSAEIMRQLEVTPPSTAPEE